MVDTLVLEANAFKREGSSPFARTKLQRTEKIGPFFYKKSLEQNLFKNNLYSLLSYIFSR